MKKSILFFLLVLFLTGCVSMPNIRPFADATLNMRTAIGHVYTHTESRLYSTDPTSAEELKTAWRQTELTLNALVKYSDALASLSEAGSSGKDAVDSVVKNLSDVIKATGIYDPFAAGVGAALTGTAKIIYDNVVKAKAANSLKQALSHSHEAIIQIACIFKKNIKDLNQIKKMAGEWQIKDYYMKNSVEIDYYKAIEKERTKILEELTSISLYMVETNIEKKENYLQDIDLKSADQTLSIDSQIEYRRKHLENRSKVPEDIQSIYESYKKKENEISREKKLDEILIEKISRTIDNWAQSHGQIKESIEKKHSLSLGELSALIEDINHVYQLYKEGVRNEN